VDALVKRCEHCNEAVSENKRGRRQRFCSDRCRQAHRKITIISENGLRYRPGRVKLKSAYQGIEVEGESKPENSSPKTSPLRCERINDSTFKITDGTTFQLRMANGPVIAPLRPWLGSSSWTLRRGLPGVATRSAIQHLSTKRSRKRSQWLGALKVIISSQIRSEN